MTWDPWAWWERRDRAQREAVYWRKMHDQSLDRLGEWENRCQKVADESEAVISGLRQDLESYKKDFETALVEVRKYRDLAATRLDEVEHAQAWARTETAAATELRDLLTIETKEHEATKRQVETAKHSIRQWKALADSHAQVIASLKELHNTTLNGLLQLRREGFNPPPEAEARGGKTDPFEVDPIVREALSEVPLGRTTRAFKVLQEAATKRLRDGEAPGRVAEWIREGKRRRRIHEAEEAVGAED